MASKSKNHWYNNMMSSPNKEGLEKQEKEKQTMDKQTDMENQTSEKKSKKASKETATAQAVTAALESAEPKVIVKITFEGESAQKILRCESELKERLSKPDLGKILGAEILTWTEKRWSEIVEENTDIDYFFAQIRKCPDRSKSIKLLKALSEKLKNENQEGAAVAAAASMGLSVAPPEQQQDEIQNDAIGS